MSKKPSPHDRGVRDGQRNVHRPPPSPSFADILGDQLFGGHAVKDAQKDRRDYDHGWKHGYGRRGR